MYYQGLINRYREYLPVTDTTPVVTLNEGNTPLIKADNLAKKIGLDANIYLKFDGCNPTGSFKDRGITMAVRKVVLVQLFVLQLVIQVHLLQHTVQKQE